MSRLELNTIQTKLKTAIQNHQMLVVKMKGDSQNLSLKKGLVELQEEIKRLSDEQKKIVVKLRESLVKPQNHSSVSSLATSGHTLTAIAQPQLMTFPSQGGSNILPVSMLAVPIAHMQQPAVSMYIHSANGVPLSQATNISLVPAGILTGGCNIINNGGGISIGSNLGSLLHGNIAVNSFDNGIGSIGSGQYTTAPAATTSTGHIMNNVNVSTDHSVGHIGSNNGALASKGNIIQATLNNVASLVIPNNSHISNNNISSDGKVAASHIPVTFNSVTSCGITSNSVVNSGHSVLMGTTSQSAGHPLSMPCASVTGTISSVIPQKPLVQPHLLQQQQQQILQMIQQQQQPHRLASHHPIKVPQYTASHIRPGANSTLVQNGNSAPAVGIVTTAHSIKVATSISVPAFPKPITTSELKHHITSITSSNSTSKNVLETHKNQYKVSQLPTKQQEANTPTLAKPPMSIEEEKIKFMETLDLYTSSVLSDILRRRNERKRRKTANPHYSFGFDMSRRGGNGSLLSSTVAKKQRVPKKNLHGPSQPQSITSKKVDDNHDDYCAACGKGGQLLMCETCRLVYHLDCLNPPLTEAPKYAWSCPKCLVSGKGLIHINSEVLAKVQNYITIKTAKLEEKKQMEHKNQELISEKNNLEKRLKHLNEKLKEESLLLSDLSHQAMKKKEELVRLTDFVKVIRESDGVEPVAPPSTSCV
ncbi:hypothetical protein Btru_069592 [Bulinus truncatus]|nr:hypothetical protein Btru_069592 [Bulinus truncatus]